MTMVPVFENALLGRVLPRGQRWMDNADLDDVRVDPGMTQAAYLGWERGADISDPQLVDWDAEPSVEDLYGYALTAELPWEPVDQAEAAAGDVLVWVNGVPLEEWLAVASTDEQYPDMVDADLLLGRAPEVIPLVLDTDILVLLEDEAEERGVQLEYAPGVVHGDNAAFGYRLELFRQVDDDDLGWGPTKRGRRVFSPWKWGRGTHSALRAHEADRVAWRRCLRHQRGLEVRETRTAEERISDTWLNLWVVARHVRLAEAYWAHWATQLGRR